MSDLPDPAAKGKCEGIREFKKLDLMMKYFSDVKAVQIFGGDKLFGDGTVK